MKESNPNLMLNALGASQTSFTEIERVGDQEVKRRFTCDDPFELNKQKINRFNNQ